MTQVLIVEDELIVARDIQRTIERAGYKVMAVVRTAEKALLQIEQATPDFVLIDIFLKGILTGIDLAIQLNKKQIPFIFISANFNQQVLEAAKSTNPYGFIVKPFRERDLLVTIDIARYRFDQEKRLNVNISKEQVATGKSIQPLPKEIKAGPGKFIGKSAAILQVFRLIEQVAPFDTSVLIIGETGTGKEVVADCIFQQSSRSDKPFIKINCAAIPPALLESELFGHEKGSFTGAYDKKIGKFELAAGGTILLDEIGEMPMDMQAKLLRVLQEKEIQRIGGNTIIKSDVRIIAATNRNLEKEVAEGRFRLDLYYRLYVFPINLPPLRERVDDIPILIDHFIALYAKKMNKHITSIDPALIQDLKHYKWPGNIRELQHLVERSILMTVGDVIHEMTIPIEHGSVHLNSNPSNSNEENEKNYLLEILKKCNYQVAGKSGAAELLNIPPTTLYNKMKKLGIKISYNA